MLKKTLALCALVCLGGFLLAQSNDVKVSKINLFSSGVGFFEHEGTVKDAATIHLNFETHNVSDVLKSLTVFDASGVSPFLTYEAENSIIKKLQSLHIDLSQHQELSDIIASQRGAEIQVFAPALIKGRIINVDFRSGPKGESVPYLSLATADGIQAISFNEIARFVFSDPEREKDLQRALDILLSSAAGKDIRRLNLHFTGKGKRAVQFGYVTSVPVWKISYRLSIDEKKSSMQGWAIIDNNTNFDWNNVALSLVNGKPVSFSQNLYAPLFLPRPEIPFAGSGLTSVEHFDSGFDNDQNMKAEEMYEFENAPQEKMARGKLQAAPAPSYAGMAGNTASASAKGEQFAFTFEKPITLERQQSAMLPLIDSPMAVKRFSVFSRQRIEQGGVMRPLLCAEIKNTSGVKLPSGAVTVFTDNMYAGDALLDFLSENQTQIINFGEDAALTGMTGAESSRAVQRVTIQAGFMTLFSQTLFSVTYTIKNSDKKDRRVLVEHPFKTGTTLQAPSKYYEKTDQVYRFEITAPAGKQIKLDVKEASPSEEKIALLGMNSDTFAMYSSSDAIPQAVRQMFTKAGKLKQAYESALAELQKLNKDRAEKTAEQDRVRKNIDSVKVESVQGQAFLKKLLELEAALDSQKQLIDAASKKVTAAETEYKNFVNGMEFL